MARSLNALFNAPTWAQRMYKPGLGLKFGLVPLRLLFGASLSLKTGQINQEQSYNSLQRSYRIISELLRA